MNQKNRFFRPFLVGACLLTMTLLTGCQQKEKVLDIETPAGSIEIERSPDGGKVDVEINKD